MRRSKVGDRLFAGKRRVAAAAPGSPEWDAATAQVEEDASAEAAFLARFERIFDPKPEVRVTPTKPKRSRRVGGR